MSEPLKCSSDKLKREEVTQSFDLSLHALLTRRKRGLLGSVAFVSSLQVFRWL